MHRSNGERNMKHLETERTVRAGLMLGRGGSGKRRGRGRGSSCPDFEAMVEWGLSHKDSGRTLSMGVSRQDVHLGRSLWRTEGRAEGQGKQGAQ